MTCTYRVGAATGSGAIAYARYVIESALLQEHEGAAKYYAGDVWARDVPEPAAELRPDLSGAFAQRLGIDKARPLTLTEIGSLMNNLTAGGEAIAGKKRHNPHQSVASVFGLDVKELPSAEAVTNVLAGKRADGHAPRAERGNGSPLAEHVVASSLRKFKMAIGVPTTRDATPEEIARVAEGRIDAGEYRKQIAATSPAIGFVDLTFSVDKSVSIGYALAPTESERQTILAAVHGATADAMAYAESVLGVARRGAGGQAEPEPAEMAWIGFQHYTSRPAVDVVRTNAQGETFTDTREVPVATSDPNLHQHRIALSSVLAESGRIASLDLSRLDGELKVFGAVFHAGVATRLRQSGVDMRMGPNGEARIAGQPDWLRTFYSRRSTQGTESAKVWAAEQGKDWDSLTGEEQADLVQAGTAATRQDKLRRRADEAPRDIRTWQEDATAAGYSHRSVLRPDEIKPALPQEERIQVARKASLPLLDAAFQKDAVLPEGTLREIAARGLIVSGLGKRAAEDIDAVIQTYRDKGIIVAEKETKLVWGVEFGPDRRPRTVVSTGHNITQEEELAALVREFAADRSDALTSVEIDQAADRFLKNHPRVDPDGVQWKAQIAMAHVLGEGPRFGLAIGVAGSGKTDAVIGTLTDALHARGKKVVAMTVPWRATGPLRSAGVDDAMAVDAFVRRVRAGKYTIDQSTVIVADEVSMIGVRQQLELLQVAREHGARIIEIGDPKQCGSVETPAIDLMARAIGDEQIPKLLTSIRQKTERGREIARLFRAGRAEEGIAAMRDDGDMALVAGGADATIQRTIASWRQRMDANAADPDYSLVVMTATNQRVLDIGKAIREDRKRAGEIGRADVVVRAKIEPKSAEVIDLPLAVGDKVRPFQRLYDADTPGRSRFIASNGDVIEIREMLPDGLRIRNAEGEEGRITWSQLKPFRAPKNDPVTLTYAYAASIDSTQSLTRTEAIWSLPDGSRGITGNKAYTALTRHVQSMEMIVSDAAERRQILSRQMLGDTDTPREADVIRNIAANLSRFQKRRLASEMRRPDGPDPVEQPAREAARQRAAAPKGGRMDTSIAYAPTKRLTGPEEAGDEPARQAATRRRRAGSDYQTRSDAIAAFADALRASGMRLRSDPTMDGKWHRIAVEGDKGRKMSGRYRGYLDGRPTGFIENFKTGQANTWRSDRPVPTMTAADHRRREADRVARESERHAAENAAAKRAFAIWSNARPTTQHDYLSRKDIPAHDVRQTAAGDLVVPLRDAGGWIRNVQTINPEGDKRFLAGGRKQGLFAQLGTIDPAQPILIAEGFATAATLREATGLVVVVAFDAGNLAPVAQAIRSQHPTAPIVFVADNDHHLPRREIPQPNVGREKAEAAAKAVGGVVLLPDFGSIETGPLKAGVTPPSDWNDFGALFGRERLQAAVGEKLQQEGITMSNIKPDAAQRAALTQAQRDAARQAAVTSPQIQAQQEAMRQQLKQNHRLTHNRGISR